ncbi:MAG: nucleotide exchange factor GrpE [Anaerolineales bacterium]
MTDEDRAQDPQDEVGGEDTAAQAAAAQAEAQEGEAFKAEEGGELSELEQLTAQAAEYLDGWQRARAELANYKKRVERERRESYQRAAGDILVKQLEILDDLERALEDRPDEGPAASWAEGIDLVHRKFQMMLDSYNVERIEAAGEPFDPNVHEAISHEETDEVDEGYVIDVVKPGYRMGDRILRPALVRVAK